jgi:hypothetical protein
VPNDWIRRAQERITGSTPSWVQQAESALQAPSMGVEPEPFMGSDTIVPPSEAPSPTMGDTARGVGGVLSNLASGARAVGEIGSDWANTYTRDPVSFARDATRFGKGLLDAGASQLEGAANFIRDDEGLRIAHGLTRGRLPGDPRSGDIPDRAFGFAVDATGDMRDSAGAALQDIVAPAARRAGEAVWGEKPTTGMGAGSEVVGSFAGWMAPYLAGGAGGAGAGMALARGAGAAGRAAAGTAGFIGGEAAAAGVDYGMGRYLNPEDTMAGAAYEFLGDAELRDAVAQKSGGILSGEFLERLHEEAAEAMQTPEGRAQFETKYGMLIGVPLSAVASLGMGALRAGPKAVSPTRASGADSAPVTTPEATPPPSAAPEPIDVSGQIDFPPTAPPRDPELDALGREISEALDPTLRPPEEAPRMEESPLEPAPMEPVARPEEPDLAREIGEWEQGGALLAGEDPPLRVDADPVGPRPTDIAPDDPLAREIGEWRADMRARESDPGTQLELDLPPTRPEVDPKAGDQLSLFFRGILGEEGAATQGAVSATARGLGGAAVGAGLAEDPAAGAVAGAGIATLGPAGVRALRQMDNVGALGTGTKLRSKHVLSEGAFYSFDTPHGAIEADIAYDSGIRQLYVEWVEREPGVPPGVVTRTSREALRDALREFPDAEYVQFTRLQGAKKDAGYVTKRIPDRERRIALGEPPLSVDPTATRPAGARPMEDADIAAAAARLREALDARNNPADDALYRALEHGDGPSIRRALQDLPHSEDRILSLQASEGVIDGITASVLMRAASGRAGAAEAGLVSATARGLGGAALGAGLAEDPVAGAVAGAGVGLAGPSAARRASRLNRLGAVGEGASRTGPDAPPATTDAAVRYNPDGVRYDASPEELRAAGVPEDTRIHPLLQGKESLDLPENPTIRDVGRALEARAVARNGRVLDIGVPEDRSRAAEIIASEVELALADAEGAQEWYRRNLEEAFTVWAEARPIIRESPFAREAARFILAATSGGLDVPANARLADETLVGLLETGRMPLRGQGQQAKGIAANLQKFNDMLDTLGEEDMYRFLNSEYDPALLRRLGLQNVRGLAGETSYGSEIMGPKIGGGFFQNLGGNFDPLTVDRWFMRTLGRVTGDILDHPTPEALRTAERRLRTTLRRRGEDPDAQDLESMARQYKSEWESAFRSHGDASRKPEWAKAAENYLGKIDPELRGTPRNDTEARDIRLLMEEVRRLVDPDGERGINNATKQAALWYPEKRLYEALGSAPTDDVGYSEAFARHLGVTEDEGTRLAAEARGRVDGGDDTRLAGARGTEFREGFDARGDRRFRAHAAYRAAHGRLQRHASGLKDSPLYSPAPDPVAVDGVQGTLHRPSRFLQNRADDGDFTAIPFVELERGPAAAEAFTARVQAAKEANPERMWSVSVPEDVDDSYRFFLSEGGDVGFYIRDDGYGGGFFRHPDANEIHGAAHSSLLAMFQHGMRYADAFDIGLSDIYQRAGMRPAARLPFDPQYAPPGYPPDRLRQYNDGAPDVVSWYYNPDAPDVYLRDPSGRGIEGEQVSSYEELLERARFLADNPEERPTPTRPKAQAARDLEADPSLRQPRLQGMQGRDPGMEDFRRNVDAGATQIHTGPLYGRGLGTIAGGVIGSQIGDTPEERGRNVLVGLGAGATADFAAGLRTTRRLRGPQSLPEVEATSTPVRVSEEPNVVRLEGGEEVDLRDLSPEAREGVERTLEADAEVAPERILGPEAGPGAREMVDKWFNFEKLGLSPEGESLFRSEAARAIEADPELSTKRVVTWDEQREAAERIGLEAGDISGGEGRLEGPEFLAAASMLTRNTERGAELLRARHDAFSPEDIAEIDRQLRVVEEVNNRLLDRVGKERTRRGRDLNSLKMLANLDLDPVLWLSRAQSYKGKTPLTMEEAAKVRELVGKARQNKDSRDELVRELGRMKTSTIGEKIGTAWRSLLLTAPRTMNVNIMGNVTHAGLRTARAPAATSFDYLISKTLGFDRSTVASRRTIRAAKDGALQGMRDAEAMLGIRQARAVRSEGGSIGEALTTWQRAVRDQNFSDVLTKYDLNRRVNYNTSAIDLAVKGSFLIQSASDRPFRVAAYEAAKSEMALLWPTREGLQPGTEAYRARVAELDADLPDELKLVAVESALEAVFAHKTKLGSGLGAIRNYSDVLKQSENPVASVAGTSLDFFVPFTTVPSGVMTEVGMHTPVGVFRVAEDALNLVKATREHGRRPSDMRGQVEVFRAQKQLVSDLSKVVTGSALLLSGAYLYREGVMTGRRPQSQSEAAQWAEEGRMPFSIKIGDKWRSLPKATSPVGGILAVGAIYQELAEEEDLSAWGRALGSVTAIGEQAIETTALGGVHEALQVAANPIQAERWAENTFATFFTPTVIASTARAIDPTVRRPENAMQALASRIPFASQSVPAAKDRFNRDVTRGEDMLSRLGNIYDPFYSRHDRTEDDPVLAELSRVGAYFPRRTRRSREESEEDVRSLVELEGPHLYEALQQVISSPGYQEGVREAANIAVREDPNFRGRNAHEVATEARRRILEDIVSRMRRDAREAQDNRLRGPVPGGMDP